MFRRVPQGYEQTYSIPEQTTQQEKKFSMAFRREQNNGEDFDCCVRWRSGDREKRVPGVAQHKEQCVSCTYLDLPSDIRTDTCGE
jgi:hypothetical protein